MLSSIFELLGIGFLIILPHSIFFLLHHSPLQQQIMRFWFLLFTNHSIHFNFVIIFSMKRIGWESFVCGIRACVRATVAEIQVFLIIYLTINQFWLDSIHICQSVGFGELECAKGVRRANKRMNEQSFVCNEHEDDDIGIDSCSTLEQISVFV